MEVPSIFLSHSGKQKDFTRRLYHELVHVRHHPFFDQDADRSLPKGHPFPARIVDGCRGCKMGIVVVSHEYMESLWPMTELEYLTFHNPDVLIYPLFYKLLPADLNNPGNLRRWQEKWDSTASVWPQKMYEYSISINMRSWPLAVQKLKTQSGDVLPSNMDEHAYIKRIVSHVCKSLPPPQRYLHRNQIKGADRMQQEIDDLFKKLPIEANGVIPLGVYGHGGSGKTTLSMTMANFHSKDFSGRSCWLEFPSEEDEKCLLKTIKITLSILEQIDKEDLKGICSIPEAMSHLQECMKRHRVFLGIDNVRDWSWKNAMQILEMKFVVGSRVMVTSQSKKVLQFLVPSAEAVVHVPSLSEEEAMQVLLHNSNGSSLSHVISQEDLRSLAWSCFYEEQFHPLLLNEIGVRLRRSTDLQAPFTRGQVEDIVVKTNERNFLAMSARLQSIFVDLATCIPSSYGDSFLGICEWLSKLYQGDTPETMRYELIQLEYHGLLEIQQSESMADACFQMCLDSSVVQSGIRRRLLDPDVLEKIYAKFSRRYLSQDLLEKTSLIRIHDLHKRVAREHLGQDAACNYFSEDPSQVEHRKVKYVCGKWCLPTRMEVESVGMLKYGLAKFGFIQFTKLKDAFSEKLEVLDLSLPLNLVWLSVQGLGSLRFLRLQGCLGLRHIEGWMDSPNLVSIELDDCPCLEEIGDIGCLQKLQKLEVNGALEYLPDLTECRELKTLISSGLKDLAVLGHPPKLQVLDLSWNHGRLAVMVELISTFTALQELCLSHVQNLTNFPDLHLSILCILDMRGCKGLESMEGRVCRLTRLEKLLLNGCVKLQRIPDLKNLAHLKLLQATGCRSLRELSLPRSLEALHLEGCRSLHDHNYANVRGDISSAKVEDLIDTGGGRSFKSLLELELECASSCVESLVLLDVSALVGLEALHLYRFKSLQLITGLGTLFSLRRLILNGCSSLTDDQLIDLDASVEISRPPGLQELLRLGFESTVIEQLSDSDFDELEQIGMELETKLDQLGSHLEQIDTKLEQFESEKDEELEQLGSEFQELGTELIDSVEARFEQLGTDLMDSAEIKLEQFGTRLRMGFQQFFGFDESD